MLLLKMTSAPYQRWEWVGVALPLAPAVAHLLTKAAPGSLHGMSGSDKLPRNSQISFHFVFVCLFVFFFRGGRGKGRAKTTHGVGAKNLLSPT